MTGLVAFAQGGAVVLPTAATFIAIGLGAFLLPLVARRVRLPAVVLEILYGVAIGPAILGVIGEDTASEGFILVLAEIGLFLLMFIAGFEIDFNRLEREGKGPVVSGLVYFGLTAIIAWVGFGLTGLSDTNERVFMTLLVAAASIGIIVPTLRDTNRTSTMQGQLTIVVGVIAEFLAATGIVVFVVWVENGVSFRLLGVPAFIAIVVVSLLLMRRIAWWYPERAERLFAVNDPDELGIRASLALLFVFVGIALATGVDPIIGAFLAGALFSYVFRRTGQLKTRLSGFAFGFFVPIFFISVGLRFPLDALRDRGVLLLALGVIVVAVVAKVVPSPTLMWRGLSMRDSVGSGVLLAGQLSVIIALAELGVQIGVLSEGLEAGAILLVGVTAVFSPIVFRILSPPLPAVDEGDRSVEGSVR